MSALPPARCHLPLPDEPIPLPFVLARALTGGDPRIDFNLRSSALADLCRSHAPERPIRLRAAPGWRSRLETLIAAVPGLVDHFSIEYAAPRGIDGPQEPAARQAAQALAAYVAPVTVDQVAPLTDSLESALDGLTGLVELRVVERTDTNHVCRLELCPATRAAWTERLNVRVSRQRLGALVGAGGAVPESAVDAALWMLATPPTGPEAIDLALWCECVRWFGVSCSPYPVEWVAQAATHAPQRTDAERTFRTTARTLAIRLGLARGRYSDVRRLLSVLGAGPRTDLLRVRADVDEHGQRLSARSLGRLIEWLTERLAVPDATIPLDERLEAALALCSALSWSADIDLVRHALPTIDLLSATSPDGSARWTRWRLQRWVGLAQAALGRIDDALMTLDDAGTDAARAGARTVHADLQEATAAIRRERAWMAPETAPSHTAWPEVDAALGLVDAALSRGDFDDVRLQLDQAKSALRAVGTPAWPNPDARITQREATAAIEAREAAFRQMLVRPTATVHAPGVFGLDPQWRAVWLPDGTRVDLRRRRTARRLIRALARARVESPGKCLSPSALKTAVWPDDRSADGVWKNRLHVALNGLRRLGFADWLERTEDGYRLMTTVECVTVHTEQ